MVVVQQQMQFLKEDSVPFRMYHLTNEYPTHSLCSYSKGEWTSQRQNKYNKIQVFKFVLLHVLICLNFFMFYHLFEWKNLLAFGSVTQPWH